MHVEQGMKGEQGSSLGISSPSSDWFDAVQDCAEQQPRATPSFSSNGITPMNADIMPISMMKRRKVAVIFRTGQM